MPTDQDWAPAVKKLVALTESGKLSWNRLVQFPPRAEEIVGDAFRTAVQNHFIAVYEYRFRNFIDEERYVWETDVAIEFVDIEGRLQWRWPATPYRWQLIDAVRGQAAGAPEFLREFLAEEKVG
jgi:hypothetical protein